jgi:hypothetical protein
MRPSFIVVGAAKSGTSSLAHYLMQHPKIYMPDRELHFFDARGGYADRWKYGVEWYENQFASADSHHLCGEKTPTYAYIPSVPKRMNAVVPDIKLIWILRDPVYRAYSNYWHAVCEGVELLDFDEAVRMESERIKNDISKGYVKGACI